MIVKKPVSGSLLERGGYYHTVINAYVNGKRKPIYRTTGLPVKNNYRKALKILEERKQEYDLSGVSGMLTMEERQRTNNMLLSDYMNKWVDKKKNDVAPYTFQGYKQMINGRIKRFFDPLGVTLGTLTPQLMDDFLEDTGNGCNGSSQQKYYQLINCCMKNAVRKDLIERNPLEKVDRPRRAKFHPSFYSPEEAMHMLECAKTDPCYIPILFGIYYGMRRSEAVGMQWSSIDFENNQIHIDHKAYIVYENGKQKVIITDEMKTETSRRTLPLIPFVRDELLKHKTRQDEYRKALKKAYSREWKDCVCVDPTGNIISPEYLSWHFKKFLQDNNLRSIRFHDLRHSCASMLVAKNVSMKQVQLWLGHSTFSTTADIYAHLNANALDESAECISGVLSWDDEENETEVVRD